MFKQLFKKAIKFGLVGFSGMILDYGITILLKDVVGINKYVANSIGFLMAATSNYILNRRWTFKSTDPNIFREYFVFVVISLAGLGINNLIIWFLNDHVAFFSFYVSKFVAIVVVFGWNFLINNFFNFRKASSAIETEDNPNYIKKK